MSKLKHTYLDIIDNEDFNKLVEDFIGSQSREFILTTIFNLDCVKILEIKPAEEAYSEWEDLIFKLGDQHYSVRSHWGSQGEREYKWQTIKKVIPKTKEVVYYE